jgi:ribosomal protein L29
MALKNIKEKSDKELQKMLKEHREQLRKFRFSISGSGTKNIRQGRNLRKEIAQILTELNSRNK